MGKQSCEQHELWVCTNKAPKLTVEEKSRAEALLSLKNRCLDIWVDEVKEACLSAIRERQIPCYKMEATESFPQGFSEYRWGFAVGRKSREPKLWSCTVEDDFLEPVTNEGFSPEEALSALQKSCLDMWDVKEKRYLALLKAKRVKCKTL